MEPMNQDWIEKMRKDYNAAPETPAEDMWSVIEGRLGSQGPGVIPISAAAAQGRNVRMRWVGALAAAAVVLVMGIGLGRMSVDVASDGQVMIVPGGDGVLATNYRTATLRHLSKSESLLTLVRNDARVGRVDSEMGQWGRALLLETRLLKDSPAGDDEMVRRLLEDLELILVQVAHLAPAEGRPGIVHEDELTLIAEAMRQQDMMMRIRSVLPIGASQVGL